MRTEPADLSLRLRLGPKARELVLSSISNDEKPDGDALDRAISAKDAELALLRERLITSEAKLEATDAVLQTLREEIRSLSLEQSTRWNHVLMMLGAAYRTIYSATQVLILTKPSMKGGQAVIDAALEMIQSADKVYRNAVREADRRYPDFDFQSEEALLVRALEETRIKPRERSQTGEKER